MCRQRYSVAAQPYNTSAKYKTHMIQTRLSRKLESHKKRESQWHARAEFMRKPTMELWSRRTQFKSSLCHTVRFRMDEEMAE